MLIGLPALVTAFVAMHAAAPADEFPPRPKLLPLPLPILERDCVKPSTTDFGKVLDDFKKLRETWERERKSTQAKKVERYWSLEEEQIEMQRKLQAILDQLEKRAMLQMQPYPIPRSNPMDKNKSAPNVKPKDVQQPNDPPPAPEKSANDNVVQAPPDHMNLGQAFLRQGSYASALAAFGQIDLRARTLDERTQLQLLIAMCQIHLGKSKDATEMLNQVIQDATDSRFSDYAQMQLAKVRFDSQLDQKLKDFRVRRTALEKRP